MKKILLLSVLISSLFVLSANAQSWNQVVKACASDRTASDFYGFSVAISGDFAIVGAYNEDHDVAGANGLTNPGSAYILQNIAGTWTQIQKIVASDRSSGDLFGYSVAIDGDYAIIGARMEAHDADGLNTFVGAGSVYIFHNNAGTWSQTQKIVASDRNTDDNFGNSVSISGDYLIVGAFQEDENVAGGATLTNPGSAYIFKNTAGTWAQQQKIVASDRSAADFFAYSVSISGDYAIVGAYSEDENASGGVFVENAGSAYIFNRSGTTWSQTQKIVASDRAASDSFGYSVGISGNYAIVGAYQEDENASGGATLAAAGSAYIFVNNAGTWSQANKIVNADRAAGDQFGYSVSISGDYAIIGANLEDEDVAGANNMFSAGSAYIFKNTAGSWAQQQKIVASDRTNSDLFGTSVAISDSKIIVGAYQEDHDVTGDPLSNAGNAGSVYFFGPAGAEMNVKQDLTNIANGGTYNFGNVASGSSSGAITFTIQNLGSADLTLSGTPKIEISGVNSANFTVTQTAVTSPVAASGSTSFTISFNPDAVASFSAQISIANDDSDENPYTFILNGTGTKIPQTITNFNAIPAKTYGDGAFVVSATATSGLDVVFTSSDPTVATCTGTNGTTITILKAGSCDVRANQSGNALYNPATQVVQTLTVNKKTITVTAVEKTKIYGDADPVLTYTYTPALVVGDNFTGALTRVAGECGVCYAQIQQGSLALSANYTIVYVPADLIINKRPVTVTATSAQNKVYGAVNPTYTYSITSGSLVFSDGFSGSLTRVAGENVGNYAIQQGTLAINANYILTFVSNDFQITQKPITISVDPFQTKVYGQANPAYTYIASPVLILGDSFTGSLIREAGENVGFYEILQGSLNAGGNYTLTYNSDDFEITPKQITINVNINQSKTYGQADPVFTYLPVGSLETGDSYSGALSRVAGENFGLYAITIGTFSAGSNYNLTLASQNFQINKSTLMIAAESDQTKEYGDADPVFTYTVAGTVASWDSFTGSLSRVAGESLGFYAILQGTLALNANYNIVFTGVNFRIVKKVITVTADPDQSKIYGESDPAAYTYSYAGTLASGDNFTGALTRDFGENIGIYQIKIGSLALTANYTLNYVNDYFDIYVKPVTVTVNPDQTKTYGESNPVYTYSLSVGSLVGTDAFSGALNRVAGENVGSYQIQQGTLSLSFNYNLTFESDNFEITAVPIVINVDPAQTKVYGETNPNYSYSVTGSLVGTDNFTGELARVAGEDVGVYAINQGTLALSSNYAITFNGENFSITEKPITVTVDPNQSKLVGQGDPVFTYSLSTALISGDNFTGALTRDAGEIIGTYAILQGTLALTANYNMNFVGADFAIVEMPVNTIIVIVDASQAKAFGDADPDSYTYTFVGTLQSGDNFTGALSRVAGENVGLYAILQGSLALDSYYNLIFEGANFEITKATPVITWSNPADIFNTEALSSTQLNATANTDGSFAYDPDFGAYLTVGDNQPLNVEFTPSDLDNYNIANATVYINVLLYSGTTEFLESQIQIYPNPTKGIINFDFADNNVENIKITDITGKIILEKSQIQSNESIDLSMNPAGIYFARIQTNNTILTIKIVLQ